MDNRHQTEREYIRYHAATSGEHLVAGIHGLAHGMQSNDICKLFTTNASVKLEGMSENVTDLIQGFL